jgi:hypothetical protein
VYILRVSAIERQKIGVEYAEINGITSRVHLHMRLHSFRSPSVMLCVHDVMLDATLLSTADSVWPFSSAPSTWADEPLEVVLADSRSFESRLSGMVGTGVAAFNDRGQRLDMDDATLNPSGPPGQQANMTTSITCAGWVLIPYWQPSGESALVGRPATNRVDLRLGDPRSCRMLVHELSLRELQYSGSVDAHGRHDRRPRRARVSRLHQRRVGQHEHLRANTLQYQLVDRRTHTIVYIFLHVHGWVNSSSGNKRGGAPEIKG